MEAAFVSSASDCEASSKAPSLSSRQLVFCSLAVLAEERNPIECLDAFGATGETETPQTLLLSVPTTSSGSSWSPFNVPDYLIIDVFQIVFTLQIPQKVITP